MNFHSSIQSVQITFRRDLTPFPTRNYALHPFSVSLLTIGTRVDFD